MKRAHNSKQRICPKCKGDNTARKGSDWRRTGKVLKLYCKDCDQISNVRMFDIDRTGKGETEEKPRYVITAAVNATKPHKQFLAALKVYCKANDAQLLVIPLRYKNPTTRKEDPDDWYDPELVPHLYSLRGEIAEGMIVMGDIKTQPTATRPLSGMDSLTGTSSGVFGHTRVAMESIATKGHDLPKLLYTTGAVTVPNYSDSKAGKKGEFHHSLGAVVVERGDGVFHARHLLGQSNGAFYDLDKYYTPEGVKKSKPIPALIAGDLHAERHDPDNLKAIKQISDALKPSRIVLHDALDFGSASHHNNFFERFRRHHKGRNCIKSEIEETYSVMDDLAAKTRQVIVVDSNHNNHFLQWLGDDRNANDLQNALIFAETRAGVLPEISETGFCDPFEWWARTKLKSYRKTKFLQPNESYSVHGIELGYHGDRGANGSRGSALGMSKIGAKTVIGHSHSPRIVDGCYQTGTSSLLDMGYNKGASSWLHSHVVIYPNGKRTHIHVINGQWKR